MQDIELHWQSRTAAYLSSQLHSALIASGSVQLSMMLLLVSPFISMQ